MIFLPIDIVGYLVGYIHYLLIFMGVIGAFAFKQEFRMGNTIIEMGYIPRMDSLRGHGWPCDPNVRLSRAARSGAGVALTCVIGS
jgi:hypothetical protein